MTLPEALWEILEESVSATCPDCDGVVLIEFDPDVITDLLDKIEEYKEEK